MPGKKKKKIFYLLCQNKNMPYYEFRLLGNTYVTFHILC